MEPAENNNIDKNPSAEEICRNSLTSMITVVDTVREPFVILDKELRVVAANEAFQRTFHVIEEQIEGKMIFELGDKEWVTPELRELLHDILVKGTFFKGYEVDHTFPKIGHKIMLLNARRIFLKGRDEDEDANPLLLLAIEDITEITTIAKRLVQQTREYEERMMKRTQELEVKISELMELNKKVDGFSSAIKSLTDVIENLKK